MTPFLAADLFRETLWTCAIAAMPLLGAIAAAALVFGVLQAATQVQDASISFLPKLAMAAVVGWLSAQWMASTMTVLMHKTLLAIPWIVSR
jgi:flagellar biosynthetic protein FliQ